MASSKKSGSTKVYQAIGNHIDQNLTERLKEGVSERGNNTIERIKGELFDVLTVGGDEDSRKEIGKNIKAELEEKLSKKEEAIKEKRKSGDIPSEREENEILILKRFIKDVDYRLGHGIPTPDVNDLNRNIYLDLDKNNEFDKDIVKNVVDDIIDSDMDDLKNNILLKRLIESDKYYEEICKEIRKYGKKLYKGLFVEDILDYLKSVKEKNSNSLEKKLLDFKVNGGNALRLREKNDIRQRFNSLEPGDRILLNDGTTIIVISKSKYGNKITFREDRGDYGTQERTENFNEFSGYRCKLGDIKEIIIGLKLPETESKTEPEPEPKPQPKTEPEPEPKPQPKTEPEPKPKPQPKIEPEPKPKPQPKTEPEPKPKPQPKTEPEENVVFEENAVLSDVSESYEDMISREVENEINDEWHNTARYNVFKKGKLFLMRGKMRKDRIAKKKENYQRTPFTNNGTYNREMNKQATRHDLEEKLGGKRDAFGNINRENLSLSKEAQKEFKEMCQEYVAEKISQVEFQNRFNQFVQNRLGLPEEQQFVATNILEKLDAIKNDNKLLKSITSELEKYLSDHNNSHFENIRTQIDNDFKNHRRDPRFRKAVLEILGNTAGLTKEQLDEKINKFIKHQKALAKASANNLQIKLDLLTNGKGAYQTNNKDRENWLFRFGNKLDKMPRWGQALTVAGISASGMLVGGAAAALGASAFAAGLAGTATLSGLVGAKNFIKKWTHHTKEQNTYEKNLTRNYEEEIAKMKEWERIRTEKDSEGKYTHGRFARYRAKRQLELYGKTTQEHLQNENEGNTKEISTIIYGLLDRYDTLSPDEKNALNCTLLDAKARLETYWAKGHNFLKSKDKNQIERDFYDLENALALSADRILGTGATINDIPLIQAYDGGKEVNYQELLEFYKKDYNSATKKFSGERARLATKWGLGTAAVTFGTSAAAQAITGTGMFAKEEVLPTTTWKSGGNDHFALGHENLPISSSTTYSDTTTALTGLPKGSTVDFYYGVGTDAVPASAGSYTNAAVSSKISTLSSHISSMSGLSGAQKSSLLSELSSLSYHGYNSDNLAAMRAVEKLEHIAEAMNSVGDHSIILNLHRTLDASGITYNSAAERFMKGVIKIATPGVEGGNKWLVVGLPWFSNTFKRNNDGKAPERPVEQSTSEPIDQPTDETHDEGNNEGHSSAIVIPPVKSDERDEIDSSESNVEKKETTSEIGGVSLKKMDTEDLEKFNKSDFTEKATDYIKDFKPEYMMNLPAGEVIYLTGFSSKSGRKKIVGYSLDKDGKMNIRLFYRSNSEGCRRCAPGMDGRRLSKGESLPDASYETTTKVDFQVGKLLDGLPEDKTIELERTRREDSEILNEEMGKQIKIDVMFPKEKRSAVNFYQGKKSEDVVDGYKKLIPEGLEYEDMEKISGKKYSYEHKHLGKIDVEVYRMKYNGKDVDIYFGKSKKDSPNKVWIENIVYADAQINSFGLYNKQINAGPLVAKPIDYKGQLPKDWNGTSYGEYVDIRSLYQENPIIKKYKELAKIKDSE